MKRSIFGFACAMAFASPAAAWEPFLVENGHVADGNERMAARDAPTALQHYEEAARQLPSAPGVHLDRGLALLESGQLDDAIESFERASQPPASREIRADAFYDMGIAQYRQADAAANADDREEGQRLFREAADSFRQSLRLRPGNADAGWNLELALRRLRESEEEEQQEQEQEQQEQEEQEQEQEQEEQEPGDEEQESEDAEGDESSDAEDESEDPSEGEGSEDGEGDQEPQPSDEEPEAGGTQERSLPPESRRVLDALQDSEQNLERHRARTRAAREGRRVEQDW